ncbi:hypothetical protein, partial [Streptomyces sp. NRRL B-24572]|uniref:hypothetical protein n=1 Tax=Streptomyces sp. NRRL B-24572 TaxID=1962156 RepID=UPI000A37E7CD
MSPGLASTDPVSALLPWLQQHPAVATALGGPGRVSGVAESLWPHLRVSHRPGGEPRTPTWATEPEVTLEVYGDPGGWPGQAALRRILLTCATAAGELPEAPFRAGQPVISGV